MSAISSLDSALYEPSRLASRARPYVAWLVLAGLVLAFVAVGVGANALRPHPLASDGLPERITVAGRHYDHAGLLTAAQVAADPTPWTALGDVGPGHAPVFAPGLSLVARGSSPTGILVETAPGAYVAYSLVGGP